MKNTTNPAADLLASQSTAVLAASLLAFEPKVEARTLTAEERQARAWIIDAIEARHDVEAAMNAWADDVDSDATYAEALIAALPIQALA